MSSAVLSGAEIRKKFLDYFASKGHEVVASSSLVPQNDPTLLFANAGMNQFKDIFVGAEKRAYSRATTCQKCVRVSGKHNDFENVGVTRRHHTFFEMLGNFSFGDYFKKDAILFGWEFITEVMKLDKSRLWVTVFENDDEAAELWATLTDVKKDRILRCGAEDNFWAMGETGPCGPCSEIHYFVGSDLSQQTEEVFRRDDGSFLEIWNLVFMQYERFSDGTQNALPKPSIDTGAGLERIASIVQGCVSNYDTDLARPIISVCEKLSGCRYDGRSFEGDLKSDLAYARDVAMRVIADHSRAVTFLIADGVNPSNDGRGYVLRRILRRAVRHGRVLHFKAPFFTHTIDAVVEIFKGAYPELAEKADFIKRVADAEERKFHETLEAGMSILTREVEKLEPGQPFPGETAFQLHDTYGFPLDLTEDALKVYGNKVDTDAFDRAMNEQRTRSREDRKAQNITFSSVKVGGEKTEFLGYKTMKSESVLLDVFETADEKGEKLYNLVFDATPFYAESGGQVGDTGSVHFPDAWLQVRDTQKVQDGYFMHACTLLEGEFSESLKGQKAQLRVDEDRRRKIMANHSATHLLHAALRKVLGSHVKQSGSRVDHNSTRFDYSHFEPLTEQQRRDVQEFVNEHVRLDHEVETSIVSMDEAQRMGAMALFGEKYGDMVRVVRMGSVSMELCGGTHVERTGQIGLVLEVADAGVAAGVRRIECFSGSGALQAILAERAEREAIAALLKSDTSELPDKVEKMLHRARALEHDLEHMRARYISALGSGIASKATTMPSGLRAVIERVDDTDIDTMKGIVDDVRARIKSGVVALCGAHGSSGFLVAGATSDLRSKVHIGNLVKEAAQAAGGKGGGRPDFAQAGGLDASLVAKALQRFSEVLHGVQ